MSDIAAPAPSAPSSEPSASSSSEEHVSPLVRKAREKQGISQEKKEPKDPPPSLADKAEPEPSKKPEEKKEEPKPEPKKEKPVEKEEVKQESEQKAPEPPKKYKIKSNGREIELTEDELLRRASLTSAAEEKFQAAAQMRKEYESFMRILKENPKAILTNPELGLNFRDLAEEFLTEEVRKEMMDPVERELEELRQYKQQMEQQRETEAQRQAREAQERQVAEVQQRIVQDYERNIVEALTASDLPKTPYTVKRIAEVMHGALKKGYEVDAKMAADFVRESYMSDINAMFGSLDGEALIKALGEDLSKKIRKYDLGRIKAKAKPSTPADIADTATKRSTPRNSQPQKLSPDEWKRRIWEKAGITKE